MRNKSSSSFNRRRGVLAGAAIALSPLVASHAFGQYQYTNVDGIIQSSIGSTTYASRALSINTSGELVGDYQAVKGGAVSFYTLAPGASTITPYASPLNYFAAAPATTTYMGGGQLVNDGGTYLASSGSSNGEYNPSTTTFTPIPADTTYNGTGYVNPILNAGTTESLSSTGSAVTPFAVNANGVTVGYQTYTTTTSTNSQNIGSLTHGVIYDPRNGGTLTDVGGAVAISSSNPNYSEFQVTGQSELSGIDTNGDVVGEGSIATATFRETTIDAVLGVNGTSGYTFTDLSSLITPLVPVGSTYGTSYATGISPNGNYIIGDYTEKTGTTTYTRAFEITDNAGTLSPAVDLGNFVTTGSNLTNATAVNDSGDVVGYGYAAGVSNAFEYTPGVGIVDLNLDTVAPGVILNAAYGVNDAGDIVGIDNNTANSGVSPSAFVLTPAVPEPSSLALLAIASAGLLSRRRHAAI